MKTGAKMLIRPRLFVLILIVMSLTACETDYLLERPEFRPSVVVNSIFKEGQPWIVNLSFSRDILSANSGIFPITKAQVSIIEKSNGREIILRHSKDGNYSSEIYPPQPDKTYELVVKVPGYDEIRASSNAPKRSNVVNIITDQVDKTTTKVNFEIQDNGSNYYIWNFISSDKVEPLDTSYNGNPKDLVRSIVKFNTINGYLNSLSTDKGNDAIATGGQFASEVKNFTDEEGGSGQTGTSGSTTETKRYLRLMTVSKDLYSYYKTVEKFVGSANHNSSFSQTPEIYSNITNGLGIFAGYTEQYKEIK